LNFKIIVFRSAHNKILLPVTLHGAVNAGVYYAIAKIRIFFMRVYKRGEFDGNNFNGQLLVRIKFWIETDKKIPLLNLKYVFSSPTDLNIFVSSLPIKSLSQLDFSMPGMNQKSVRIFPEYSFLIIQVFVFPNKPLSPFL
jgi:hypothetical protein